MPDGANSKKDSATLHYLTSKNKEYYDIPADTVTAQGWKIRYMATDSIKLQKDAYVEWSNESMVRRQIFPDVLEMRSYFIPKFKAETDRYIYLTHGCSTDCRAVTILPKNKTENTETFTAVIGYDIKLAQVAYILPKSFEIGKAIVEARDLKRNLTKTINFKGNCSFTIGDGCMKKVVFNGTTITLAYNTTDEYGNPAIETQTVDFTAP